MTRYVVAVSGGVDSVVLLDILSQNPNLELIVAHFDHGIRKDSHQDAMFTAILANKYGLKFEGKREELGPNASEELARDRRYDFLRSIAKKYDAKLATAHHADDVVETVAINCIRGTGWRGLAVLDSDVIRPIIDMTKDEVIKYANEHQLTWHEDSTNSNDMYLRNKVRKQIKTLDDDIKRQILALWATQKDLKKQIDNEVKSTVQQYTKGSTLSSVGGGNRSGGDLIDNYGRYFFNSINEADAIELLRQITDGRLTRPQLAKALIAIKTISPGKLFQAGDGVNINFTSRNFTVELIK